MTKNRVKILEATRATKLEADINVWLSENEDITVISEKYNVAHHTNAGCNTYSYVIYYSKN